MRTEISTTKLEDTMHRDTMLRPDVLEGETQR